MRDGQRDRPLLFPFQLIQPISHLLIHRALIIPLNRGLIEIAGKHSSKAIDGVVGARNIISQILDRCTNAIDPVIRPTHFPGLKQLKLRRRFWLLLPRKGCHR
jgi:hypothetical protein